MVEISQREHKIYRCSKQMDSLFFKLYYLKYAYESMINTVPENYHPSNELTEQQKASCDKVNSAMEQVQNELYKTLNFIKADYDDFTDHVPF